LREGHKTRGKPAPRGVAVFSPCPGSKRPNQRFIEGDHLVLGFGRVAKVVVGIVAVIGFRCSLSAHAEDFDAGKSAPQLFASNCSTCHHTPHGLAKRMSSWSLNGFLREHYTASRASADTLTAYLLAQGSGVGSSRSKRSELVSPSANHRKRSTLLPPADVPNP
jgi:hypothetical protein